ncbi:MAG: hypothetical protein GY716_09120 [bacterium]|nr:hypothetical protein [bacterium]
MSLLRMHLIAALLTTVHAAVASSVPPRPAEPETHLVIEITQLIRRPAPPEFRDRRAALVEQIASADSRQARVLRRQLKALDTEMEPLRSFVLDGWSSPARPDGTLRRTAKLQRAVLLPSNDQTRAALRRAKTGDFFLVSVESARDLFVNEGRRYTQATNARPLGAPKDWIPTKVRRVSPARPDPNGARGIRISIVNPRVRNSKGRDQYRYSVRVEAPLMHKSKRVLQVWYHVYVETTDGVVIGPLPASDEFVDRAGEGISLRRGWDLLQLEGGPKLDVEATRLELIASRWSDRMSS